MQIFKEFNDETFTVTAREILNTYDADDLLDLAYRFGHRPAMATQDVADALLAVATSTDDNCEESRYRKIVALCSLGAAIHANPKNANTTMVSVVGAMLKSYWDLQQEAKGVLNAITAERPDLFEQAAKAIRGLYESRGFTFPEGWVKSIAAMDPP